MRTREEWRWQRAALNSLSPAVTAAAETCSWPSTTQTRNMGLSDSRYSRYLGRNKTEGNLNSHGAQSVQSHRRGLERASRAHSTHEFRQCFCHRNVIHSFLLPFYFLTDHKPNRHLRWLKQQLQARHWNTARTELLWIHNTPSSLAVNCICYRSGSVATEDGPAHTPQGSGAAPCPRYHQHLTNHGGGCWTRFSNMGSTISLARPVQLITKCGLLQGISTAGPNEDMI